MDKPVAVGVLILDMNEVLAWYKEQGNEDMVDYLYWLYNCFVYPGRVYIMYVPDSAEDSGMKQLADDFDLSGRFVWMGRLV